MSLTPSFIYGLNARTKQNVHFISNEEIVYPAGGVLVCQLLNESLQQSYIHLHDKQRPLNVICISPKKDLVATGVGGPASISLYSVTERCHVNTLEVPQELKAQNLACLQFTCDGQFVVAVTGPPEWTLLCYNVASRVLDSKTRANMATQPTGVVTQVACNPGDPTTLAVVGPGLFRLLQLVDGSWRQFGFYKAGQFPVRSAAWLTPDRLLAGTEDGRILLVESNELKAVFLAQGLQLLALPAKNVPVEENIPGPGEQSVNAIVAHQSGFLLGLGNPCEVVVYRHDHGTNYPRVGNFTLQSSALKQDDTDSKSEDEANAVWWLAISPDRNCLLVTTVQVQLYSGDLAHLADDKTMHLMALGEPLHRGAVVSVATCVWRHVFVTCGLHDRSVRVWNYTTAKQELAKTFSSQPLCVSLHPLALLVLVGFAHSVCLLSVQLDDLTAVRELAVRNCRACVFSTGGQLFAVAHGNKVQIVSSITFNIMHSLHGHCAEVEGLSWWFDDTRVVTCGADGAVYEWEVSSGRRVEELVTKGTFYQDVCTMAGGKGPNFVVAGDANIREILRSQLCRELPCGVDQEEVQLVGCLVTKKTLLLAARCGSLLAANLPLGDIDAGARGMCMHSAAINKVGVSADGQTVISVSEDGSVCVWKLGEQAQKQKITVEQVLVGRTQLRKLTLLSASLSDRLSTQQEEQRAALEHQARAMKQTLEQLVLQQQQELVKLQEQIKEAALSHATSMEETRVAEEEEKQKHEKSLAKLEDSFQTKLVAEYARVEQLERRLEEHQSQSTSTLKAVKEEKEAKLNQTIQEFEAKIFKLEATILKLQDESEVASKVHEEVVRQIEEDADREMLQLKVEHERALREARNRADQLAAEVQSAAKRATGSLQEIQELEQKRHGLQEEVSHLKSSIELLEQHIKEQAAIMDRNNAILENKERELAVVRGHVDEMAKDKETLSFRLDLLSQHVTPKEQLIKSKTLELQQLGEELREERNQRAQLQVEFSSSNAQLRQAQRRAQVSETRERDARRDVERLRARVHQLGEHLQQPKLLVKLAADLYREYGLDGSQSEVNDLQPSHLTLMELKGQLEALQELNQSLVKKIKTAEEQHRIKNKLMKQECISLMQELEALRKNTKKSNKLH